MKTPQTMHFRTIQEQLCKVDYGLMKSSTAVVAAMRPEPARSYKRCWVIQHARRHAMSRLIKTALTVGFTVLVQRAVTQYLDHREERRAVEKAARTGFATDPR
jgi:hypothetical protein